MYTDSKYSPIQALHWVSLSSLHYLIPDVFLSMCARNHTNMPEHVYTFMYDLSVLESSMLPWSALQCHLKEAVARVTVCEDEQRV